MENQKNILDYDTVALDEAQDAVIIIDQTLLPGKIELIALHTAQEMWDAIYLLKVRGAPAIGVAAALGIYLLANRIETEDFEEFYQKFTEYKEYLDSSRPTATARLASGSIRQATPAKAITAAKSSALPFLMCSSF